MSDIDKLLAKGAQWVTGDLIFKHKVLGMMRFGSFILTPEGEAELAITDVVVKEVKKPRAKKAEVDAAPVEDVTIEL